jgi:hypothetical protein
MINRRSRTISTEINREDRDQLIRKFKSSTASAGKERNVKR